MDEIRGKLKNLKKKEKSKSRNKVMKNNINDLKELYREIGTLTIGSGSDLSNNVGNSLRDTRDDRDEVRSQQPRKIEQENKATSLLSGQVGTGSRTGKLKYYERKKYQLTGIHMDLDDETLEGDDDKAGKERQKLIYLLAKREKEMQKKLKQLNEDVNYVMRSRLTVEGRRRGNPSEKMPVRRRTRGGNLLEKEEENLRKKLDNYEHEVRVYQQKIEKRKGEMMSPNDNKEALRIRKEKLEEEVRLLKQKVKRAESGIKSPEEGKSRHHENYNNDYIFNYKSRGSEKDEEGWAGHVSKEFKHEMEQERRLHEKNKVVRKEITNVRVRLKKEIEVFLDKQKEVGNRKSTGEANGILGQLEKVLAELQIELNANINALEENPNAVDQNVKEKELLGNLIDMENQKINQLAGNMELLKVLRRNNSSQKLASKTSQLDISNILESSWSRGAFRDARNGQMKQNRKLVHLRKRWK